MIANCVDRRDGATKLRMLYIGWEKSEGEAFTNCFLKISTEGVETTEVGNLFLQLTIPTDKADPLPGDGWDLAGGSIWTEDSRIMAGQLHVSWSFIRAPNARQIS